MKHILNTISWSLNTYFKTNLNYSTWRLRCFFFLVLLACDHYVKNTFNLCLTLHNFRKWSSLIAVWISFSYISINYPCSKFIKICILLCFLFSDSFTTLRASCSYSKVYATFLIWKWIIIQFSLTSSSYVSVRSYNVIPSGIFICLVSFLYKKKTHIEKLEPRSYYGPLRSE